MNERDALDIVQQAIWTIIIASGPAVGAAMLVGTIIALKITDLVVGVRASEEQEIEGLDLTEHGEEAYNLEM